MIEQLQKPIKTCTKCDDRGMIATSKYSARSCECNYSNRLMEYIFKDVSLEQLLSYAKLRIKEKGINRIN